MCVNRLETRWFILGSLIAIAGISCKTSIPIQNTFSDEIAINGILIAGAPEQRLLITALAKNIGDSLRYVQDARVEVNGVSFAPLPAIRLNSGVVYNWATADLKIECGQACSLRVFFKSRLIRGQTIVPATIEPVTINSSVISWKGNEALRHQYAVWINNSYFGFISRPQFNARTYLFPFRPGRYRVQILAYDQNYVQSISSNDSALGLEGAYGLFASACAWEDSVDLE